MMSTKITLLEPTGTRHIRIWLGSVCLIYFEMCDCCFFNAEKVLDVLKTMGYGGLQEKDLYYYPPYNFNEYCDIYIRKESYAKLCCGL